MQTAGYSGTPLARKLGLIDGCNLVLSGAPDEYMKLIAPLPADLRVGSRLSTTTDIVHVFATRFACYRSRRSFSQRS